MRSGGRPLMLWLLPLLPLGAGALVLLLRRRGPAVLGAVAVAALVVVLGVAILAAAGAWAAPWPGWGPRLAPGIAAVGAGRVMAVLVPAIAAPVVLYAAAALRDEAGLPRLLALLVAFTGAMELLVLAADFLTLLVAWEIVGACSWALVGYAWRDAARPRAAQTAFLTTRAGDLGLYLAAAAAVAATGSLRFDALASGPSAAGTAGPLLGVVAAGVLVAAAAKSAQLPFSPWLFAAMAGPTPASALLHSATMVAAGAYLLVRLAPALGAVAWFGPATAALGLATALAGGVVATVQRDFKRALAASTSAQYGLMFVAVGAGVPGAAAAHLVAHAGFKALLFLAAGVAQHAAGTLDLGRMRLGTALPGVARLTLVGALALAAVPPLGAAYTKEQVLAAAATGPAGGPWLAAGVLAAGALSALYGGRLYLLAFGRGGPAEAPRPSRGEVAALALLAVFSAALSVLWLPGAGAAFARAAGAPLAHATTGELALSLASIAAALAVCWALWRRGALLTLGLPDAPRAEAPRAEAPRADALRAWAADWFGLPALARRAVAAPGLAAARALATFDDRAVDAGLRAAVRLVTAVSRAFAWWGERGVDGVVTAAARATTAVARASRDVDDRGVDAAVEGVARGVGTAGAESRRLQTGLVHHYYVIAAVGLVAVVAAAALGRAGWLTSLVR